jgi:Cu/Zn superoxide dismutase
MRVRLLLTTTAFVVAGVTAVPGAQAQTKTFHADMTTAQEVPPTAGTGTGKATFTLDPATKELKWTVTYSGLSADATAAHIHGPAAPGANAGVAVNLAPSGVKSPLEGSATLTDAQIADLTSGKDYVNVHTVQNKGGEIRGQIKP